MRKIVVLCILAILATTGTQSMPRMGVAGKSCEYGWQARWQVPQAWSCSNTVPMIAWDTEYEGLENKIARAENNAEYALVFNECEHPAQCDTSPLEAAEFYEHLVSLEPHLKLIVGGFHFGHCGREWWQEFWGRLSQHARDVTYGIHFHVYAEVYSDDCDGFYWLEEGYYERLHGDFWATMHLLLPLDKEIWVTEMGCINSNLSVCQGEFYVPIIDTVSNSPVKRYAWFTDNTESPLFVNTSLDFNAELREYYLGYDHESTYWSHYHSSTLQIYP